MVLYCKDIVLKEERAAFIGSWKLVMLIIFMEKGTYYLEKSQNILEFCRIVWNLQTWLLQWIGLTVKLIQSKTVVNLNWWLLEGLKLTDSKASL